MAGSTHTDDDGSAPSLRNQYAVGSVWSRIVADPRPALIWVAVLLGLFSLEAAAAVRFLASVSGDFVAAVPGWSEPTTLLTIERAAADLPTLLSRETIPNAGYWSGSGYVGTFMGLSPMHAWLLRIGLIYGYALVVAGWFWVGYKWFRANYRAANWTPRDDVVDRFRNHYWGIFGLVVVFLFLVFAIFAPALGPTTVEQNIDNPYSHEFKHWNAKANTVETTTAGVANQDSRSVGSQNVGPMTYDDFGRFHPFGTLPSGTDLFTFLALGSRISLMVGVSSVLLSSFIATILALFSAYYKGVADLTTVLISDAVMALPQLLLLIMLTVVLADTWIGNLYSGAFILGVIFAGTGWPYLWRALRGPALQVSEQEWVDAARSFGQKPRTIMRKHMLPYIAGYLMVYGSMTIGGAIIAIAGLSYLGLGVNPGTPEWGAAVNAGQDYVASASWHISLIPGILITLVVTGFNALGDGIRDAIDPQSEGGSTAGEAAGRGGGG